MRPLKNPEQARSVRINELLQQYWNDIRADRLLPLESDVSAEDIRDIWDSCFLVSVKNGAFAYDYLGQDLIAAYGDDYTGHEIAEALVYPHPPTLFAAFQVVCREGKPLLDDSEFINSRGQHIKYRSCVLPLAAHAGTGVAFLLGGMKWKAYEASPA